MIDDHTIAREQANQDARNLMAIVTPVYTLCAQAVYWHELERRARSYREIACLSAEEALGERQGETT